MADKDKYTLGDIPVVLSDDTALVFNRNRLTWPDVRTYFMAAPRGDNEEEKASNEARYAGIIAKAFNVELEFVLALGFEDFRRLDDVMVEALTKVVDSDPS